MVRDVKRGAPSMLELIVADPAKLRRVRRAQELWRGGPERGGLSLRDTARALNKEKTPSVLGGKWTAMTVRKAVSIRLGAMGVTE
jgi:hypothetical protein